MAVDKKAEFQEVTNRLRRLQGAIDFGNTPLIEREKLAGEKRCYPMPDTDEFEIQLIDGFNDAILGCIYEDDGTPLPCYSSEQVMLALKDRGMTEDEAMSELLKLTEGVRLLWIHPLEIA